MVVAVHVEDVAPDLLEQGALGDVEEVRDLHAREGGRLRAQEVGGGLSLEHHVTERSRAQPAPRAQVAKALVEGLAAQLGIGVVEHGQVEIGDETHGRQPIRGRG